MKIINIITSFALLAMLFVGCDNNSGPSKTDLLTGMWVNTMVNEHDVLTDETFVMEFRSDNIEMYANGYQLDDNNKIWKESTSYTYNVSGDIISISGTDILGNSTQFEMKIQSIDNNTITFTVPKFLVNGVDYPDENTYTSKKVTDDYSDEFIGVWYGRCTTVGNPDSLYHYWEYFEDGSFNYYYQDENSNWIKKSDNEGLYFLYGQLMVSNYSHDLISGGTGLAFECWNFTINGNKMEWTGLQENNATITYKMEKVQSPPDTVQ